MSIRVAPERAAAFTVSRKDPAVGDWRRHPCERRDHPSIGDAMGATPVSTFAPIHREWREGDEITLSLPMRPQVHVRTHSNTQESRAPDDSPVRQEVLHFDYLALTRGPLVYATGLIDGYKIEETLRVPLPIAAAWLETLPATDAALGPDVRVAPLGRAPLVFSPYFRAGGRRDRSWRLTWMQLAPESP